MFIIAISVLSVIFQFFAALKAIFLIKLTGQKTAWILLSFALIVMIIRRIIVLVSLLDNKIQMFDSILYLNEFLGLMISLGMLSGVEAITKCFRNIKKSEQNFKNSESLYKSLIRNFPNGAVMLLDRKHKFIVADGVELHKSGLQPEDMINRIIDNVFPDDISTPLSKIIDDTFLGVEKSGYSLEWRNKVFSTFTVPVYHEINTNIINYVLLIAQNITKEAEALKNLEESEAELKKSNASKDRFFSIIAHDLKNPLGGFVNLCKLLVEDFQKMNDIEKMETISTMYDSAVHLFGLLENLLEWSRAQRNVIKYEPELYNIKNFVDYNFNLVKSSAAKKRIHLILNVPDSIIVFCDFNTINTVIRNILSNAVKFTYEGGAIIISATENDRYCNLIIKDNGVGISEDNLKKFFQIDCIVSHPGTNNEKGTGLGLIICKEFIEMNHGSIKIESINMKGTTVEISIPKAKSF